MGTEKVHGMTGMGLCPHRALLKEFSADEFTASKRVDVLFSGPGWD